MGTLTQGKPCSLTHFFPYRRAYALRCQRRVTFSSVTLERFFCISIGILETIYLSVVPVKILITTALLKSMTDGEVPNVARLLALPHFLRYFIDHSLIFSSWP